MCSVRKSLVQEYWAKWLSPKSTNHTGYSTPYGHLKQAWLAAQPEVVKEKADSGYFVHLDGQAVNIRDGSGTFRTLHMEQLRSLAIQTAAEANRLVKYCLPADCEYLYESFDCHQFNDNLADPTSVFLQPQNLHLIQPIQIKILNTLLKPGEKCHAIVGKDRKVNSDAVKWYAGLENEILANISMHLGLTCGVSPREFQYKSLLYDSLRDGTLKWRCMFIVDNCWCLGHPDAKKTTNAQLTECLWLLTHMISMPLIGTIRPTMKELTKMIGDEISVSKESRIFVQNYPIVPRALDNDVMSGSDVNANMQRLSPHLPVHFTCNLLRSMVTTLLEHCSPMLLGNKKKEDESVVACPSVLEQGQHEELVAGTHYVRSLNVPLALGMMLEKARFYINHVRNS